VKGGTISTFTQQKYESTYPIAKGNLRQLSKNCTPETPEKMRGQTE